MRYVALFVIGLFFGAIGTVSVNTIWHRDIPYSHAVMAVMKHHTDMLAAEAKSPRCDATATQQHLTRLMHASADIRDAFPHEDPPFYDEADKLVTKTQQAIQAAPADCAAVTAALKPIHEVCKSCHDQYR